MRGVGLLAILGFLLLLLIILTHGLRQVSPRGSPGQVTQADLFQLSEGHLRGKPLYRDLPRDGKVIEPSSDVLRRRDVIPTDAETTGYRTSLILPEDRTWPASPAGPRRPHNEVSWRERQGAQGRREPQRRVGRPTASSSFYRIREVPGLHRRLSRRKYRITDGRWAVPWAVWALGGGLLAAGVLCFNLLAGALPWSMTFRETRRSPDLYATEYMVEEAIRLWAALEGREECLARASCRVGGVVGGLVGGPLLAAAAQGLAPTGWEEVVSPMAEEAVLKMGCRRWKCGRGQPEGDETS